MTKKATTKKGKDSVTKRLKQQREIAPDTCIFC